MENGGGGAQHGAMEERRGSRIPRPTRPSSAAGTPLQEKVGPVKPNSHTHTCPGSPPVAPISTSQAHAKTRCKNHATQSPNVAFGLNSERRLTTTDRKRKAAGLDVVPEYGTSTAKRTARAGPSSGPARSAPAPVNRTAQPSTSSGGNSFGSVSCVEAQMPW